jgi:ribonuclease Z
MAMLSADISYRIHHHDDLTDPPVVHVTECVGGMSFEFDAVTVTVGETDHRPVEPSIGFRIDHEGVGVVLAGDTIPCAGLDQLCLGAEAFGPGQGQDWRDLAAGEFTGRIELGDDLHHVTVTADQS